MTDKELGTAAGEIFAKAFTLGYETGREYVPVGGRVLTAEQVEDVEALVATANPYSAPAARLRALFPATEPTEVTGQDFLDAMPTEPDCWDVCEGHPAPAEPAEEETKAEVHDPDALAKRLAWIWHDGWDACGERERGYLRRAAEMAHSHYASSPVVPAPTETGPWQDISEAPKHLTLIDRVGDKWTYDGDNWVTPETAILPVLYINRKYAPFVSAEEGRA